MIHLATTTETLQDALLEAARGDHITARAAFPRAQEDPGMGLHITAVDTGHFVVIPFTGHTCGEAQTYDYNTILSLIWPQAQAEARHYQYTALPADTNRWSSTY